MLTRGSVTGATWSISLLTLASVLRVSRVRVNNDRDQWRVIKHYTINTYTNPTDGDHITARGNFLCLK